LTAGQVIQMWARLAGIILMLVGVLGFVPGSGMSAVLNVTHLVSGLVGVALAQAWETARVFLLAGAVAYVGVFVANLGRWDDALNIIIALFMLVGWGMNRDDRDRLSVEGR
jgi:hypothetical protein